jgi:hypothetical protein
MQYHKLKLCVERGRLQLSTQEKFSHYFVVITAVALAVMGLVLMITSDDSIQFERSFYIFSIASLLAVFFYIVQYRRLTFVILKTGLSREEIANVIDVVALKIKWHKQTRSKNYYTAITAPSFWEGSWGEQITIILHHNRVYINSICSLKANTSLTSWGRNKKNIDIFRLELNKAGNLKSFN